MITGLFNVYDAARSNVSISPVDDSKKQKTAQQIEEERMAAALRQTLATPTIKLADGSNQTITAKDRGLFLQEAIKSKDKRIPIAPISRVFGDSAQFPDSKDRAREEEDLAATFQAIPSAAIQTQILTSPHVSSQAKSRLYQKLDTAQKQQFIKLLPSTINNKFKATFNALPTDAQFEIMKQATGAGKQPLYKTKGGKELFKEMINNQQTASGALKLLEQARTEDPTMEKALLKTLSPSEKISLFAQNIKEAEKLEEKVQQQKELLAQKKHELVELNKQKQELINKQNEEKHAHDKLVERELHATVLREAEDKEAEAVAEGKESEPLVAPEVPEEPTLDQKLQTTEQQIKKLEKESKELEENTKELAKLSEEKIELVKNSLTKSEKEGGLSNKDKRSLLLGDKLSPEEKGLLFSKLDASQKREMLNLLDAQSDPRRLFKKYADQYADRRSQFFNSMDAKGQANLFSDLLKDSANNPEQHEKDLQLIRQLFIKMDPEKRTALLAQLLTPDENGKLDPRKENIARMLIQHNDLTYDDLQKILKSDKLNDSQSALLYNSLPNEKYFDHQAIKGATNVVKDGFKLIHSAAKYGGQKAGLIGWAVGIGCALAINTVKFAAEAGKGIMKATGVILDPNSNRDRKIMMMNEFSEDRALAAFNGMKSEEQNEILASRHLEEEKALMLFTSKFDEATTLEQKAAAWEQLEQVDKNMTRVLERDRSDKFFEKLDDPKLQAEALDYYTKQNKGELAHKLMNNLEDKAGNTNTEKQVAILQELHKTDPETEIKMFKGLDSKLSATTPKLNVLNKIDDIEHQHHLLMGLEDKELAKVFNDKSLLGGPTLKNSSELFEKLANDDPNRAITVLKESGFRGNGGKLLSDLAQSDPKAASDLFSGLTEKEQKKYISYLSKNDPEALGAMMGTMDDFRRDHAENLMDDTAKMYCQKHSPSPFPTEYSFNMRSMAASHTQKEEEKEEQKSTYSSSSMSRVLSMTMTGGTA